MFISIKYLINIKSFPKWNYSSALYITGDKAQKTFAVLVPVIDFEKRLEGKEDLAQNIRTRGLNIDLEKLEKQWQFFQFIDDPKKILEHTRTEIGHLVAALLKNPEENKEDIEKLRQHAKLVKDDLKNVKQHFYGVEESTMLKVLSLPNILHEKTPPEKELTIHTYQTKNDKKSRSHLEIGETSGYIKYINPYTCYIKSDAALFEICILNYFRKCMLESNYIQFSNPNFCRSIVVEGCGDDNSEVLTLEEYNNEDNFNRLHLCGNSSLHSFMAYFSRHFVLPTDLPMKYFSLGKRYQRINNAMSRSLFSLSQQPVLNIFIASTEEEDDLESVIKEVRLFFEQLGYHFRLIFLPANQLDRSESLKLSIQMYSNYLESYVEIGNISSYESYLSKRLLFTYNISKEKKYPKVISGTLINVSKLLGCVLENNSLDSSDLLTNFVKKHMYC